MNKKVEETLKDTQLEKSEYNTYYRVKDPTEFVHSDWVYKDSSTLYIDHITDSSGNFYASEEEYKKLNERRIKSKEYKSCHGFEPCESWNLNITIAHFIYPRLKKFRQDANCFPIGTKNIDEWYDIIDKMLLAFALIIDQDNNEEFTNSFYSDKQINEIKEGLELFAKYFNDLWW